MEQKNRHFEAALIDGSNPLKPMKLSSVFMTDAVMFDTTSYELYPRESIDFILN